MSFNVYLCGYISGEHLDQCVAWRKQIIDYFKHDPKWYNISSTICFIDPLCGKNLKSISSDGNTSDIPSRAYMLRDYYNVKNADLIIVNLDTFGGNRPLIGSIYELAWAWETHKPVIAIGKNNLYIDHPFIQETAVIIVPTVEDMLNDSTITYYFKGAVSAEG